MSIIALQSVSFAYGAEPVLQDVSLNVRKQDFLAIIGPNGGGKTTLLKIILGLLRPQSGTVLVDGREPSAASGMIGYVPQDIHLNSSFPVTALDVVQMGLLKPRKRLFGDAKQQRQKAFAELDRMGMGGFADRKISSLSGGQRQRVLIARALVSQPKLLILDEPTASIDSRGQTDFYDLLQQLNTEMTIVVVSHDLLAISRYIKSVACVSRTLYYHDQAEITDEMMAAMYPVPQGEVCPVELVGHGLPHRVLSDHTHIHHD